MRRVFGAGFTRINTTKTIIELQSRHSDYLELCFFLATKPTRFASTRSFPATLALRFLLSTLLGAHLRFRLFDGLAATPATLSTRRRVTRFAVGLDALAFFCADLGLGRGNGVLLAAEPARLSSTGGFPTALALRLLLPTLLRARLRCWLLLFAALPTALVWLWRITGFARGLDELAFLRAGFGLGRWDLFLLAAEPARITVTSSLPTTLA